MPLESLSRGIGSINMDRATETANVVRNPAENVLGDRRLRLAQVLDELEQSSATLESLELTLALALLDHAIAEVRDQLTA